MPRAGAALACARGAKNCDDAGPGFRCAPAVEEVVVVVRLLLRNPGPERARVGDPSVSGDPGRAASSSPLSSVRSTGASSVRWRFAAGASSSESEISSGVLGFAARVLWSSAALVAASRPSYRARSRRVLRGNEVAAVAERLRQLGVAASSSEPKMAIRDLAAIFCQNSRHLARWFRGFATAGARELAVPLYSEQQLVMMVSRHATG